MTAKLLRLFIHGPRSVDQRWQRPLDNGMEQVPALTAPAFVCLLWQCWGVHVPLGTGSWETLRVSLAAPFQLFLSNWTTQLAWAGQPVSGVGE